MANPSEQKVRLQLTVEQVKAVATLLEDQVFRVKFIDPKMPGYKKNPEQVLAAEAALAILKDSVKSSAPSARHDATSFRLSPAKS
ncbi:MAG TPA: hypothetical protein VER03_11760 [Bryobacteraceae bacterium]|nr:hypothetical protein [Bryobacteraceae bacterium]